MISLPTIISVNFDSGSSGAYATPRNASSEGCYRHAGVSRRVGGYPNLPSAGQVWRQFEYLVKEL